jgi:phage terminase small subunit
MPRQSAAARHFTVTGSSVERLRPPPELTEIERQIFVDIAAATKSEHFRASDLPLLVNYVQAIASAREANEHLRCEGRVVDNKPSPWLAVLAQAQKAVLAFAHRLRLSPQGRSPTVSSRPGKASPPLSYYERMEQFDAADEG